MIGQTFPEPLRIYFQAEQLRRAFPGWAINVQAWAGDRPRIEAVNRGDGAWYCLVSSNAAELWRELQRAS